MKSLFLYEHLSAGEPASGSEGEANPLLAEGVAMRDALLADLRRLPGWRISVAAAGDAALPGADARSTHRRPGESVRDFVAREAAAHDLSWIVAPETDGLLADFHALVPPGRWLGCDAPAIAVASSKAATAARLDACGIATPRMPAGRSGRFVVKPDDGAGAMATRQHRDRASADADLRSRRQAALSAVLEPWVDGEPLSLSLLCAAAACEVLSVNQQQVRVDGDGVIHFDGVQVVEPPWPDDRMAALDRLAQAVHAALPGLRGYVGIDLVWHAQLGPVVIEVNPRVTTAWVSLAPRLRATQGRNLAGEVIALHLQERPHG